MDLDAIEKYLIHRHYVSKIFFLILWIVFKYIEVYFYLFHSFTFLDPNGRRYSSQLFCYGATTNNTSFSLSSTCSPFRALPCFELVCLHV